jgi:hypothetical protein
MSKKPETTFKEQVLSDLGGLPNTWVCKVQQVSIRGIPDLILCCNGHFVAIELKKDAKSKPDSLQQYHLKKIKAAGGNSCIAHPDNWEGIYDALVILSAS